MNRIYIRDLTVRCVIGAFPEERNVRQDVLINIEMVCDFGAAAETDALEDTVNYKTINKRIVAMVEASDFHLIETMAERIAEICLGAKGVQGVRVTVDKPGALRFARSVAVEVERKQPGAG